MKTTNAKCLWLLWIAAGIGFACAASDSASDRKVNNGPPAGSSLTLNIQDQDLNNIADPLDALIEAQLTGGSAPDPFTGVASTVNPIPHMQVKLNFINHSAIKGQVLIQWTMNVPKDVNLKGAVVGVAIADVARAFVLDARGSARNNKDTFKVTTRLKKGVSVADNPTAKVAIKIFLTSDDLQTLATPGDPVNFPDNKLDANTNVETLNVPVLLLARLTANGVNIDKAYSDTPALNYKARVGKTATAKTMGR
jgi:hypothetical protein